MQKEKIARNWQGCCCLPRHFFSDTYISDCFVMMTKRNVDTVLKELRMGYQSNKHEKRTRRKNYKERLKQRVRDAIRKSR